MTARRPSGRADNALTASAMARVASDVAQAESVPVSLLGGYLEALVAVAETGRRLTRPELDACCQHGEEAAGLGVPLRAVVDAYLTATWQAWDQLPAAQTAGSFGVLQSATRAVLRAADDAAAALADGYERGQRITIRREEALRREFIDDLFGSHGDLELLVDRAERFGLHLGGRHAVAVATAEEALGDATPLTRQAEAEVLHRFGSREVLVATKGGLLVCVVPAAHGVVGELAGLLRRLGSLRVGVGRPQSGPRRETARARRRHLHESQENDRAHPRRRV